MKYFVITFILMHLFLSNFAHAGQRFALLIGNSNYQEGKLKNPRHDASDLGKKLRALGFETTILLDSSRTEMESAIGGLHRKLRRDSGNIGLFYFSGHGLQTNGENYLIPIGAMPSIHSISQVKDRTISAQYILGALNDAENAMNIVILDACRTNPFRSLSRSRSVGLSSMSSRSSLSGSLIAFATAPGTVASDGSGRNSPYIASLLKHIDRKNHPIELLLKDVRADVKRMTNNKQLPWYNASIEGNFYFNEGSNAAAVIAPPLSPKPPQKTEKTQGRNDKLAFTYTDGFKSFLIKNQQLPASQYCQLYAATAVRQTQRRQANNCSEAVTNPARWSLNAAPQQAWCLGADKAKTRGESIRREEYLKRCLSSR